MPDQKNDPTKSTQQDKGSQMGDAPKSAQSATLSSHNSRPLEGQVSDRGSHRQSAAGSPERSGASDTLKESGNAALGNAKETMSAAKDKAGQALGNASEWAEDTYDRVSDWAADKYESGREPLDRMRQRSSQSLRRVSGQVQDYISENPMVLGLVGLAAGLLIGALLPRTRRENEAFGEWSDELRHQGVRYAREATQKGREFVEESFEGDDPRFNKHKSEFKPNREGINRH